MKHSDKLFFLVSLAVLGSSLGCYFFLGASRLEKSKTRSETLLAQKAKGIVWKEVAVPKLEFKPIEWPEVRPQDESGKWFFQVFTPPQIWVDNDGKFITESPYIKEQARQAFSLKYGGISNEPYPVKYTGYMGTPDDPRIQFNNEAEKTFFSGKINQPITMQVLQGGVGKTVDIGITVKSFDRKRVKNDETNTISEVVKIVLFDKKFNREIVIYSDKPTVIEDSRRMTFILPDSSQWHVKTVGESKEVGGAAYTVKSLDFDKGQAVVEMVPSKKEIDPQVMLLSEAGVSPVKK